MTNTPAPVVGEGELPVPETIYLQTGSDEPGFPAGDEGVSWCRDRIHPSDVQYTRASPPEEATNGYLIWWTNQADCEAVIAKDAYHLEWPDYLRNEFGSRLGRNGRGRLWTPHGIPLEEVPWDDNWPLCRAAKDCGGVVIHAKDRHLVQSLPGFLTDTTMRKALNPTAPPSQPIERDEQHERDYIPIGAGWEIQTKGKGSSFRISDGKDRWNVLDSHLHAPLERMAREIHAAQPSPAAKGAEEALRRIYTVYTKQVKTEYGKIAKRKTGAFKPEEARYLDFIGEVGKIAEAALQSQPTTKE